MEEWVIRVLELNLVSLRVFKFCFVCSTSSKMSNSNMRGNQELLLFTWYRLVILNCTIRFGCVWGRSDLCGSSSLCSGLLLYIVPLKRCVWIFHVL